MTRLVARILLHQEPLRRSLRTQLCHWVAQRIFDLEMASTSSVCKTRPNAEGRIKVHTQLSILHQITWTLRAWLDWLIPDLVLPDVSSPHQCRQWTLTLHC